MEVPAQNRQQVRNKSRRRGPVMNDASVISQTVPRQVPNLDVVTTNHFLTTMAAVHVAILSIFRRPLLHPSYVDLVANCHRTFAVSHPRSTPAIGRSWTLCTANMVEEKGIEVFPSEAQTVSNCFTVSLSLRGLTWAAILTSSGW